MTALIVYPDGRRQVRSYINSSVSQLAKEIFGRDIDDLSLGRFVTDEEVGVEVCSHRILNHVIGTKISKFYDETGLTLYWHINHEIVWKLADESKSKK